MTYFTKIDRTAIHNLVSNPRGPVMKDLKGRARRMEALAKRMVGSDTGALRRSITTKIVPGPSPQIFIGSPLRHAEMHHRGTRRHVIHPRFRRTLRFKVNGRVVYATEVIHPGTRPNPYLTVPLKLYGRG